MSEKKTKLMQDAEKAIANMELSKKEMESAREKNAKIREAKDKASSKKMESAREENAKIRECNLLKKWNLQEKKMLK
jgi:hypothetical protein